MVRRLLGVLVIATMIVTLAGCVPKPLADADLIGTWVAEAGGSLSLSIDGTVVAQNVPRDVWIPSDWNPTNLSGVPELGGMDSTGTWDLRADYPGIAGQVVEIVSDRIVNVAILQSDGSLAFVLGDPDLHHFYSFERSG